jgi:hypothetical protein
MAVNVLEKQTRDLPLIQFLFDADRKSASPRECKKRGQLWRQIRRIGLRPSPESGEDPFGFDRLWGKLYSEVKLGFLTAARSPVAR